MRAEEEHGARFFGFSCKSNLLKTKKVVGCGWTKEGACGGGESFARVCAPF
jgi:hypothetical protein